MMNFIQHPIPGGQNGRIARKILAGQDGSNHGGIGDHGDQLPSALAVGVLEDVDFENPLHQCRESIPPPALFVRDLLRAAKRFSPLSKSERVAGSGFSE